MPGQPAPKGQWSTQNTDSPELSADAASSDMQSYNPEAQQGAIAPSTVETAAEVEPVGNGNIEVLADANQGTDFDDFSR